MKCHKCKRKIADDSNYCEFCGTKVERSRKPLWITLIIGLLLCVSVGEVYMLNVRKQKAESNAEWNFNDAVSNIELSKAEATPTTNKTNNKAAEKTVQATGHSDFIVKVGDASMKMIYVEGGSFTMGGTSEQGNDIESDETPHKVTLSGYWIGETEVTVGLWIAVMGNDPSYFKNGDDYPVENVSWKDAMNFCEKLSAKTGKKYSLPTEAQWEFAARGGNKSKNYKYSGSNKLSDVAWYLNNSSKSTHKVKTKKPNELSIYDMSGNVWEWCADWYGNYSAASQTDPTGPSSGSNKVRRGGSWYHNQTCRVAFRCYNVPGYREYFIGLRVVCNQ